MVVWGLWRSAQSRLSVLPGSADPSPRPNAWRRSGAGPAPRRTRTCKSADLPNTPHLLHTPNYATPVTIDGPGERRVGDHRNSGIGAAAHGDRGRAARP